MSWQTGEKLLEIPLVREAVNKAAQLHKNQLDSSWVYSVGISLTTPWTKAVQLGFRIFVPKAPLRQVDRVASIVVDSVKRRFPSVMTEPDHALKVTKRAVSRHVNDNAEFLASFQASQLALQSTEQLLGQVEYSIVYLQGNPSLNQRPIFGVRLALDLLVSSSSRIPILPSLIARAGTKVAPVMGKKVHSWRKRVKGIRLAGKRRSQLAAALAAIRKRKNARGGVRGIVIRVLAPLGLPGINGVVKVADGTGGSHGSTLRSSASDDLCIPITDYDLAYQDGSFSSESSMDYFSTEEDTSPQRRVVCRSTSTTSTVSDDQEFLDSVGEVEETGRDNEWREEEASLAKVVSSLSTSA